MFAGAIGLSADGADRAPDGAAHRDLLFDAALDLGDEVGVFLRAEHIAVGTDIARAVFREDLRVKNTGNLAFCRPVVVRDPRFSPEELRQNRQGGGVEALIVPVGQVVAQPDAEAVDLLGLERRFGIEVDLRQLCLVGMTRGGHSGGLLDVQRITPCSFPVPTERFGRGRNRPGLPPSDPAG